MPKVDPRGEVANPIRTKLAHDIARRLSISVSMPPPQLEAAAAEPLVDTSPPLQIVPESVPAKAPGGEPDIISTKLAKPKKVLFTVAEQKENDAVMRELAEAIGAQTLGWSHVNRALWSLLRRAQDQIETRRSSAPHLMRPSNGNPIELAKFEDDLAQYLLALFKDVPRQPWK